MELGMIGLGRMGSNIVRRLMRAGHHCIVYDIHPEAAEALTQEGAIAATSIDDFVRKLKTPRVVWMMLPAAVVDPTLKTLVPLLLLIFAYVAAFGGLITAGRIESSAPGLHFRYLKEGEADEAAARVFFPLYWAVRKAGVDLIHEPLGGAKP